jgi:hypothetical protein
MSKFKVGDRVVRTSHDCEYPGGLIKVGDVGVVTATVDKWWIAIDSHPLAGTTLLKYYDLAPESELERLVRVANEGVDAVHELSLKYWCDYETREHRYVVKPKPTFEPFYVGPMIRDSHKAGWLVKLEGDTLHVGCKQFHASTLYRTLKGILGVGLCLTDQFEGAVPRGCKDGIVWCQYQISWADVEHILEALEKAGINNV